MKKTIISLAVIILILAILFLTRPFAAGWLSSPPDSPDEPTPTSLSIEAAEQLSITQGKSEQFLQVSNHSDTALSFKLDLAHSGLSLEPREGDLAPGATREIILHVGDLYPPGRVNSLVYLLTEKNGETLGMEAYDLSLRVNPGELKLEIREGKIAVLWNDEPAPPGTTVYFREPDKENWVKWYTIPRPKTDPFFYSGTHTLQFMAELGEIRAPRETFELTIEGLPRTEEPQPMEDIAFNYFVYMVGTTDPEVLEYMGYSEDMEYLDLINLMGRLDSESHEQYIELQAYTETLDILKYIEHLNNLN